VLCVLPTRHLLLILLFLLIIILLPLLLIFIFYLNIRNKFIDFGCYTQFYSNLCYDCMTMKMEALWLFETLLTTYQSTLCKIPEVPKR